MTTLSVTLDLPTPLNRLYRISGRRLVKNPDAAAYGWHVLAKAREAGIYEPIAGPCAVTLRVFYARDLDIDAVLKNGLDAMQNVLYLDDKQITELHVTKAADKRRPRLEVEISEVTP